MSKREGPPQGTRVYVDVFPEDDWSVEVSTVDTALHKLYGNPLDYDWTCESEDEARMTGELFARSNGYEIAEVRRYAGRD